MRRLRLFRLTFLAIFVFPYFVHAQGLSLEAPKLSLPIIIGFGLLDSINPCVIGVLLLMLTMLLKTGQKQAVLRNGAAYVAGVYVTYLVGGLTLLGLFNAMRSIVVIGQVFYFVIGAFVLLAGLLEIKDYFWYGRWFALAIPRRFISTIEAKVTGVHASLVAAFSFGALVTLVELPCTGAPYLAVLTLMSQSGYQYLASLPLLLFYNLVFVLPLIVIIYLAYRGVNLKRMEGWRKEKRGLMRLFIGLALSAVAIWIVTTVADYLLFPLVWGVGTVIGLMSIIKYLSTRRPDLHADFQKKFDISFKQVEKRSGKIVPFDQNLLLQSLTLAMRDAAAVDDQLALTIVQTAVNNLKKSGDGKIVPTAQIRRAIAMELLNRELFEIHNAYFRHRFH